MATNSFITPAELQEFTLGQALAFKAQREPKLAKEIASVTGKLSDFNYEDVPILDTPVKDLSNGKAIASWNTASPYSLQQLENAKLRGEVSMQGGVLEVNNRLNAVFTDAGLNEKAGPESSINKRLESLLSDKDYKDYTGYTHFRARVKKVFSKNPHKSTKAVLARLNVEGKIAERNLLGFKYFSGLRMTDTATLEIQNYDPVMGSVDFIEGKSRQEKTVILRPGARAFFESAIGERESGLVFPNLKTLTKKVNDELKDTLPTVNTKDNAGNRKTRSFNMSDYRNLEESVLVEGGLGEDEKRFASGRMASTEASKYVDDETFYNKIEPMLLLVDAKLIAYSETANAVQYFQEIGISEEELPEKMKSVTIAKDLITAPRLLKTMSPEFLGAIPDVGGGRDTVGTDGSIITYTANPRLTEAYIDYTVGVFEKDTVENNIKASQGKIALAEIQESPEFKRITTPTKTPGSKKAVAETEVDFGDLPPHLIEALTNLGSMTSRVRELKEPEKKTDPDIVGMIDVGFGLPSTLGSLDETPKEEPSFKDWKSTIRKNLGKVGKINAAVTLGKAVYKSLQPPKEGEPDNLVTPYSVGESISNTAKDLFSSTEEVVSPPSPSQTSMNPEYNLPSEMQQSLQPKPTPAYTTDSRPFEERLQEYRQYMQNLREGK